MEGGRRSMIDVPLRGRASAAALVAFSILGCKSALPPKETPQNPAAGRASGSAYQADTEEFAAHGSTRLIPPPAGRYVMRSVSRSPATISGSPAAGVISIVILTGFPPGLGPIDHASTAQVALGYQLPTVGLLAAVAFALSRRRAPAGAVR